jgi:hypothetical protein
MCNAAAAKKAKSEENVGSRAQPAPKIKRKYDLLIATGAASA